MTQLDPMAWVGFMKVGPIVASAAHRPTIAHRSMSLRQVGELLVGDPGGALLIDDPGHGVEVVSLRDLAAAVAQGADPDACTVGGLDLIRRPYVDAFADLSQVAATLVEQAADGALVLDEDGLVGMVSMRDICRALVMPQRGDEPSSSGQS